MTTLSLRPTVVTVSEEYIPNYVVVTGNVTSDGGATVTTRGILFSYEPNAHLGDAESSAVASGSGTGTYSCSALTDLLYSYARAYATNSQGTSYGADILLYY